jgi:hypothetical protein
MDASAPTKDRSMKVTLCGLQAVSETGNSNSNAVREVFDIATQSDLLLHLTDYHLESCRLALAEGERGKAAEHLTSARELVAKTGYHRRDGEVKELEEQCG